MPDVGPALDDAKASVQVDRIEVAGGIGVYVESNTYSRSLLVVAVGGWLGATSSLIPLFQLPKAMQHVTLAAAPLAACILLARVLRKEARSAAAAWRNKRFPFQFCAFFFLFVTALTFAVREGRVSLAFFFENEPKSRQMLVSALQAATTSDRAAAERDIDAARLFASETPSPTLPLIVELTAAQISLDLNRLDLSDASFVALEQQAHSSLSPDARCWAAILHSEALGRTGDALAAYRCLDDLGDEAKSGPWASWVALQMAKAKRRSGQPEAALQFYALARASLTADSGHWKCHLVAASEANLLKACPAASLEPTISFAEAQALWQTGRHDDAISLLTKESARPDTDPMQRISVLINLAIFYWRQHEFAKADLTFAEADRVGSQFNVVSDKRAFVLANWAGMRLSSPGPSSWSLDDIGGLLSRADEIVARRPTADVKAQFEIKKNRVQLLLKSGRTAEAWTRALETSDWLEPRVLAQDPDAIAHFYEDLATLAAGEHQDGELATATISGAYWWLKARDLASAERLLGARSRANVVTPP